MCEQMMSEPDALLSSVAMHCKGLRCVYDSHTHGQSVVLVQDRREKRNGKLESL